MEQQLTIGKRIATLRKNQGWTQEQLGEKVGVSAQAVSKWENDQACPDITIIPLLAELFGVSTDELLGVKPIDPHVVILDKEKEINPEDNKKHSFEFHYVDQWSGIMSCITAILVCVMLIIRSTTPLFNNPEYSTWSYIWPLLVLGAGLIIARRNILAVAYLIKILLVKLGVIKNKTFQFTVNGENNKTAQYTIEDDTLIADLSFGSNHITYEHDTLKGMKIETNFGDHQIDLRNVKYFVNEPVFEVEVNFGNVIILLPSNVKLYKNSETAFAAMKVKGEASPNADQIAYLKGDVNFGNLEVCYPE